jgi:hypothetical protein
MASILRPFPFSTFVAASKALTVATKTPGAVKRCEGRNPGTSFVARPGISSKFVLTPDGGPAQHRASLSNWMIPPLLEETEIPIWLNGLATGGLPCETFVPVPAGAPVIEPMNMPRLLGPAATGTVALTVFEEVLITVRS